MTCETRRAISSSVCKRSPVNTIVVPGGSPDRRPGPAADPPARIAAEPAVIPEPDPAPEPAPEEAVVLPDPMIAVTVRTRPPGAEVWRVGEDAPMGGTPLTTTLPRAEEEATFELRRPGFQTHVEELSLAHDVQLTVGLRRERVRRPRRAPAPAPRPSTGRRGVLTF